jgi:hypothetical protein
VLRERRALDPDAHARRLPGDAALLRNRFGGGDDPARDQALTAFVLAREHEDRVALGDLFAAIHRLLRDERERFRPRIDAIAKTVSIPAHPLNLDAGFSINGWLAVLLTFLLARVFAEGTLMREDLEGTV